jgi:1-acyl-sn-glycerol-3-phosphate acyltransferase
VLKSIIKRIGCIPIDRARRNSQSLKMAENLLKNGAAFIIYPEGTYSKDGQILPLKFGAVSLSQKAQVPIIPVVSTGRYRLWRRGVRTEYLPPIQPSGSLEKMNQKLYDQMSAARRRHLAEAKSNIQPGNFWLQTLLGRPLLAVVKFIYRPKIVGADTLPPTGAMVLAANHKHVFDQFLPQLGLRRTQRPVYFAKAEYAVRPIGRLMRHFNVVFVDRQAEDKSLSIHYANQKIQRGDSLIIFPEGTRNKSAQILRPFKFGAVSFAYHNHVPVVPVAIVGIWKPFGSRLKVVFGKPIQVKTKKDYQKANEKLYNSIRKMLVDSGERAYRPEIFSHYQRKGRK